MFQITDICCMNRTLIFHFFAAEAWKNKGYLKLTKKVKKLIFVILTYFDAKIHISVYLYKRDEKKF
jgi:hypothetical protein